MNRSGRAVEAGLEGATIALLNDGDPLEVAAWSAGSQAGGSLLLSGMSGIFSGGPTRIGLKILGTAAGVGTLLQILQVAGPQDDPSLIGSIEAGFPKVVGAIALGSLSGIAGLGRVSSRFPVNALPQIADAISALPRGATISVLNELLQDPAAETVVQRLASDPNFFGARAGRRIQRALTDETISLSETVENLMSNSEFREAWEGLQ